MIRKTPTATARRYALLLSLLFLLLLLLSLPSCTPPPDISAGFDEQPEASKDESPLAADRHKNPNAQQRIDWEREPMLQFQGYCYFFRGENVSPAHIKGPLIEIGRIPSTVPRQDIPVDSLQTNFGFVGYTVYRDESQPQYLYIMDNGTFHVLESPARAERVYDMPRYLRCNDTLYVVSATVRELPLPDYFESYTEIGVIQAEDAADRIPYDDLTTNCGYVGSKVYISPYAFGDGFILLEDGYVLFNTPVIARPSIRYQGALYLNDGAPTVVIASSYHKIGSILGFAPPFLHATADFYCNFGSAIGCEVYGSTVDSGTIYVLKDGMYHPYTLQEILLTRS